MRSVCLCGDCPSLALALSRLPKAAVRIPSRAAPPRVDRQRTRDPEPVRLLASPSGTCTRRAHSDNERRQPANVGSGTGAGGRTLTPLRAADFKSAASAIPPLRHAQKVSAPEDPWGGCADMPRSFMRESGGDERDRTAE